MAARRRKVSSGRSRSNSGRRVARKSSPKRSYSAAPKRRAVKRTRRATAKRSVRSASTPRTVRVVLETAGVSPVRAGEAVGIGQKVARAPRLKPKF